MKILLHIMILFSVTTMLATPYNTTNFNLLDTLVIGSGPAGLAAATYAAQQGLSHAVITGHEKGGTLRLLAEVNNWPNIGNVFASGYTLAEKLLTQAQENGVNFFNYEKVVKITDNNNYFTATTSSGKNIDAKTILIATGITPTLPSVEDIQKYLGRNIAVCTSCSAGKYRNKIVIIYGDREQKIIADVKALQTAKKIIIITPNLGGERLIKHIEQSGYTNVTLLQDWTITALKSYQKIISHITIRNNTNHTTQEIKLDGMFIALGTEPNAKIFSNIVTLLDAQGFIKTNNRLACINNTGKIIPGIFAAGDVATPGLRQAYLADEQGKKAMKTIEEYLKNLE